MRVRCQSLWHVLKKSAESRLPGHQATVAKLRSKLLGSPSRSVSSPFATAVSAVKTTPGRLHLWPEPQRVSPAVTDSGLAQRAPLEDRASLSPGDYLMSPGCSPATVLRLSSAAADSRFCS